MNEPRTAAEPPWLIQGGMGVGVSGWRLARAVARTGQLGVVSGTALDTLLIRVLQSGDPYTQEGVTPGGRPPVARRSGTRYHTGLASSGLRHVA